MKRQGKTTRNQRGSVAVVTGLTIAVLFGFLGLAIDLGRMFVIKAELQTGMDACALAASSQLRPGLNDPASLDRAIAYGRTPANRANFQAAALDPNAIQFSFAADLAGPYTAYGGGGGAGGLANLARYVRCTYPLDNIPVYFMRVLNGVQQTTVAATAVGTLMPSQHNCGFPVAVCRGAGATAPNWGLTPGQWVSGLGSTGGGGGGPAGCSAGTGTGNFCWVDFSPPAGGASELSALIKGQGQCQTAVSNPIGQTGVAASLVDAWNTRFGIYKRNQIALGSGGELGSAPPDRTGYAYTALSWPAMANAYPDFSGPGGKRATSAPFNPGSGTGGSGINVPGGDQALTSAQHTQFGRDRRLVLAPIVNCSGFTTSQTVPMDAWACMMLLAPISNPGGGAFSARMEYLGPANLPGSPCATSGLAGGTAGPLVPVLVQ
jgi:hypothetical protein